MNKKIIFSLAFLCTIPFVKAQDTQDNEQERSNILEYTPSKLVNKGDWDFKVFNNLYTQTVVANGDGDKVDVPRSNFFTTTIEAYTGVSKNSRVNVGLIVNVKSNTFDQGALSVLAFENNDTDARAGITSIAPSLKVQPFKDIGNFSVQSSFHFPVFREQTNFYLDRRSYIWENKFFYDYTFAGDKFQIFGEIDFAYYFGEKAADASDDENAGERFANNSLGIPVSAFFSYFPSDKFTVFVNGQHFNLIDLGNNFTQNYTLAGIGLKYQIIKELNIEVSSAKFLRGKDNGLGNTFNLGLRYLLTK